MSKLESNRPLEYDDRAGNPTRRASGARVLDDVNALAAVKLNFARAEGEKRVVVADPNIEARAKHGAALTYDDLSGLDPKLRRRDESIRLYH